MVKINSILAASALGLSVLAHPTIKHNNRSFCPVEERDVLRRGDTLTSRATIPKATTWNPPSNMVTALNQVWSQTMKENPDGLKDKNWITDQLVANNGNINYCVRWNHKGKSTAADRASTVTALQRSLQKWVDVLAGFEGFPITKANVKVVGYAVKDKSLIQGDTSGLDIYTTVDGDGVPECDVRCYRGAHLDGNLNECPGGKDRRYDISLWLDESLEGQMGGYGYNWGQELGPDYFLQNVKSDNIHILLHEMGHGFGLLDFYDWVPSGQTSFVMMAGSAMEITEFDAWMLRDWYRKLKVQRGW
ncbi:hypothetical protein GRF29_8g26463 [Pseudopithomyces chartarum]|uniref:Uncharacterized protein n=1 Tax=Pseudopithomyces chartarum TaxID=1892770 RepID=A0AAN6M6Y5_9PLEO|nr:hypothetical protein GRF29_8g26463 [Pseudopithomyces chartarum]